MNKSSAAVALASAAAIGLAAPAAAMTWTLEPLDYDPLVTENLTQEQLGGTMCPCTKIPYPADGFNDTTGVLRLRDAINYGVVKPGDTVMGFSLGSMVITQYLNQYTPPPGINFLLMGADSAQYGYLTAAGSVGLWGGALIKAPAGDNVTILINQYDGWGNYPQNRTVAAYATAANNAQQGESIDHNYTNATLLNNTNNVTWTQNGITYELIPSAATPVAGVNRASIDTAYGTPGSQIQTAMIAADAKAGTAATAAEQVPPTLPNQSPEPVLNESANHTFSYSVAYPLGTNASTPFLGTPASKAAINNAAINNAAINNAAINNTGMGLVLKMTATGLIPVVTATTAPVTTTTGKTVTTNTKTNSNTTVGASSTSSSSTSSSKPTKHG